MHKFNPAKISPFWYGIVTVIVILALFTGFYKLGAKRTQSSTPTTTTAKHGQPTSHTNKTADQAVKPVNANGGTVSVLNPNTSREFNYDHAHVTMIKGTPNGNASDQLIIVTQSGQRIRPSANSQITYPKSAIAYGGETYQDK